jgi:hypothetical protein
MMALSLEQASAQALEAAEAGDLDALALALEARQKALDRGEVPTPGVLSAGTLTAQLLRLLLAETRAEESRLRQLWNFVATPPSSLELRG